MNIVRFIEKNLAMALTLGFICLVISGVNENGKSTGEAQNHRQIKDVIMVIDLPGVREYNEADVTPEAKPETPESSMNPTILDFTVAFGQAAAPIIVSAATLEEFLQSALDEETLKKAQEDIATLNIGAPQPSGVTEESLSHNLKMIKDEYVLVSVYYLLSKDKWFCFADSASEMFILIPKTHNGLASCGFNPKGLKQIDENLGDIEQAILLGKRLHQVVEEQYKKPLTENELHALNSIKNMFVSKMDAPNNSWNIYLVGHGDLARSGSGDVAAVSAKARIAGFSFSNFKKFIEFLNGGSKLEHGINTLFLFYISCFVGGYNQEFVCQTLNDLNVNFFAVAQGTGDEMVSLNFSPRVLIDPSSRHAVVSFPYDFSQFFAGLKLFFTDQIKRPKGSGDLLLSLVKSVVGYWTLEFNNQPFVYIPKVGVFGALNIDKRVYILTSTEVKAYEFENEKIAAWYDFCLMVYPSRVNVEVGLSEYTKIMSLQAPQLEKRVIDGEEQLVVPANYKSIHYFDSISIWGEFENFLYSLLSLKSPYMQVWLFKDVFVDDKKSKKGTSFKYVMIFGKLPGVIYILKTDEKNESFKATITSEFASFQGTSQNLLRECRSLSFTKLTTTEDFNPIIDSLGLKTEVAGDVNSIGPIFDALAKKTQKSTDVQELGALKRILKAKKAAI